MRRMANGETRGKCLGERRMVGREVNGLMQIFLNRNRFICDKERSSGSKTYHHKVCMLCAYVAFLHDRFTNHSLQGAPCALYQP